jgi:hypothetical protein
VLLADAEAAGAEKEVEQLERQKLLSRKPEIECELVSSYEYFDFEPTSLGWDDLAPRLPGSFGLLLGYRHHADGW